MDQLTVQEQRELIVRDGYQRERIDGFVEVGEQAPREAQGIVIEAGELRRF